jgi:hypothetical protein
LFAAPRNAVAFLTPLSVFLGKGCFALCGGRLRGFAPKTPTKGDTVPFGNPWLRYNDLPLNSNLMFKITNFFTREKKICEKIKKLQKTLDRDTQNVI